jgi:hypothetical protein
MYNDSPKDYTETLTGHASHESAFVVDDYPYSWHIRTKIRYWIETTKHGQRFVSQTMNPKTGNWNKPKAGTYSEIKVMVRNPSNGYVGNQSLDFNDSEEEIANFENLHASALDERATKIISHIRAHNTACSRLTWTCGPVKEGDAPQTMQEQIAIINALTRAELAKG